MKKYAVALLALAIVAMPSCKNQNKKSEGTETKEISQKEALLQEDLKINVENLVESAKKIKSVPFAKTLPDGTVALTDKEKMVKPDYLLEASVANNLVTLSQKYRTVAMLTADKIVADLYEMPTTEYKTAISKLIIDLGDDAVKDFADTNWEDKGESDAAIGKLVDAEYAAGRSNFFWEATTAFLVEQLYVITRNIDKFMPMFTDETAADVTYNFVCVHEGITQMIEFYPEMESLNNALLPLYVINAISVDQLKEQLTELKGEIEAVRYFLLK
ncbi:MAG: hypothetical protein MJY69_08010 [Bacteroidales bacterium]|nr:hypothetical protein [Bacteroidales bacterium]